MTLRGLLSGLLCCAALVQLSCDPPSGPPPGETLVRWQRWARTRPSAYAILEKRMCFCPGGNTAMVVVVEDGAVTLVMNTVTHTPLPPEERRWYKSVDELFAMIDSYAHDDEAFIDVEYDDTYGYPSMISVNPYPSAVDDEFVYVCSDLVLIPELNEPGAPR